MNVSDIEFKSAEHVVDEIRNMNVKGGSPFGRAAAWAYKLICEQEKFKTKDELLQRMDSVTAEMLQLKPTMATIHNSRHLVYELLAGFNGNTPVEKMQKDIVCLAEKIINYSLNAVEELGAIGANLISDGDVVMMHSYSSALMSIFTKAAAAGIKFKVICTESRPLRESRLAASVLQSHGVSVIYITDASIWEFMPQADYIIMGADSIVGDGSVANKIGTALISQLALSCKKDVYIASEVFKLDRRTQEGYRVVLERRTIDEIVSNGDFESLDGIEVINQFFDLTPARNITGLITEFGIIAPSSICNYWDKLETSLIS